MFSDDYDVNMILTWSTDIKQRWEAESNKKRMSFCQIFILVQLKTVFTKTFDDFGFGEFNCRGLTQLVMPIDTGINFGLKRTIHVEAKKKGTHYCTYMYLYIILYQKK